jgi:DNA-directed RNA polymerase specialized sigma24 family protein
MAEATNSETAASGPGTWFTTTHWSLILNAQDTASPLAAAALEKLCRAYWLPLYVYLRRQGEDEESAKDLTQGFFARLLEKHYLTQVHPGKGKFRCFLLVALKHFLADERDRARAQKRGGGQPLVSLDASSGEARYRLEPVDSMDAEKLFERRWALTLLEQARSQLKEEYLETGKSSLYERLKVFEAGDKNGPPYAELAVELGLTESGVKAAVFRLRQRYRELVRQEVANTVDRPDEVDGEIRHLISVISG